MKKTTKIKLYMLVACVAFAIIGSFAVLFHSSATPTNPNGNKDSVAMVDKLENGDIKRYKTIIPEDLTIKEIAEILMKDRLIVKETFLALAYDRNFLSTLGIKANSIEGYLFPNTYYFDHSMSTRQIIKIMHSEFLKRVTPEMEKRAKELGLDLNQFVTLASIIGKESDVDAKKPVISAMFHDRLKKGMRLQSSPTAVYDLDNFDGKILRSYLKKKSPYNTYVIKGLPPGPIGNPGLASLKAALYPTQPASPQEIKTLKSWSNKDLWDSFVSTEKYASFSVVINDQLPAFNFKIVGSFSKNNSPMEDFIAQYIEVINPSKKEQQRLNAKNKFDNDGYGWGADFDLEIAALVQFVDLNFDGYLDLRLLNNTGATGNNWYASYIYDPASGKFKFQSELSKLSGIRIDGDNKQIVTYSRIGYCEEAMEYYKVVKDKLVLVKAEWTEIDRTRDKEMKDGGFGCFKYTGIPHNKKIKTIKEEPLYGSLDKRARGPLGNPLN